MAQWQLPPEIVVCITAMAGTLHARLDIRLLALLTGVLFARGKRTVASWLRGAGVQNDYKNHYYFLGSLGRKIKWVGMLLLAQVLKKVPTRQRLEKLERAHPTNGPGLWLVCVDEEGRILDDGSRATRPWIGTHYHDVPRSVAKVIAGVDPLIVLGLQANGEAFGTTNEIAATTSEA